MIPADLLLKTISPIDITSGMPSHLASLLYRKSTITGNDVWLRNSSKHSSEFFHIENDILWVYCVSNVKKVCKKSIFIGVVRFVKLLNQITLPVIVDTLYI